MREYLIALRTHRKMSQKEVATKMLISQNYLSLIELGARQVDLKLSTIKGFSKIYGVDINYLISEETKYLKSLQEVTQ